MSTTQPTAFVTGGTGFIGSHLIDRLLSKGYHVRALVRNPKKLGFLKDLPIEIIEGDLFSNEALEKGISGSDYVYHVAGLVAAKSKEEFLWEQGCNKEYHRDHRTGESCVEEIRPHQQSNCCRSG
jgi:uncharacterized protein YbjT (DUF2867 family)